MAAGELAFLVAENTTVAVNVAAIDQGWERLPGSALRWRDQDGRSVMIVTSLRDLFARLNGSRIYLGYGWDRNRDINPGDLRRIAKARRYELVEVGRETLKPSNPTEIVS